MSTSVSYVKQGRAGQKTRTLEALLVAARQLMVDGLIPTIEQAAAKAGISRATAYRYFPNQRDLLIAVYPVIDRSSLLPSDAPESADERVEAVARAILREIVEYETVLRAHLRMSLDDAVDRPELPLRKGRRLTWFEDACSPLRQRMSKAAFRRLTLALASYVSLEVMIWLVDLAQLSRAEAVEQMVWTARRIVAAAAESDR